jgi:hypothetical protein
MENQQAIDLNNQYLTLFPRDKKTPTTPDYGGNIGKGVAEALGNVILYVNKNKKGDTYFSGYFYGVPEKLKLTIMVQSQQYDNPKLPALIGTISLEGGKMYNLTLWQREYKNGKYYNGKISLP